MSTLVAYIAVFLGAGIFAIAGGIPLTPVQIIWLNMVIDIPIAIALGFDQPTQGLMARKPRPVGAPVLTRGELGPPVRAGRRDDGRRAGRLRDRPVPATGGGATMLLTTLSLFHVVAGLLARDQRNTIFSREAIPGPVQLRRYGFALLAIIAVTAIGFLQRINGTVSLTFGQWWICIGIALTLLVVEELIKFVIRRRDRGAVPQAELVPEPEPVSVAA